MITGWKRYLREHPRLADGAVAVLLFVGCVPATVFITQDRPGHPAWWNAAVLLAVSSAALLWQRSHTRTVVAVTTVCAVVACALGYLLTPLLLGPLMVALYRLAVDGSRKVAFGYASAVALLLAFTTMVVRPTGYAFILNTVNPAAMIVIPALLGYAVQNRRAYQDAVAARVAQAEHAREEEVRHRVAEERMRIARELHDVVAHHLALANAQTGTIAYLMHSHPVEAEKLLVELAGTTSSALRELKATVGLLRQGDDAGQPLEPSPGLERLPDLAEAMRTTGLTVTLSTEGTPQQLSPGVDLTAYRIIQEALTNVSKHAGTAVAEVELTYSTGLLNITVRNEAGAPHRGPRSAESGADSGYGLLGMRERAQSVGGRLRAEPRPGGGFEVAAALPLHPRVPDEETTP
ncbi:sensor histidine kinase [Streptacidiphilus sp. N1-10]|uniref:histidine kinase n=1 Tax=Streptacidiphilus jeojiensis TaxID=3229225 RepID=A0ABV6XI73_9ACTN